MANYQPNSNQSYNFLPPLDQFNYNGNQTGIGDINQLDKYLPQYNLTFGSLTPLVLDPSTNIPTNLVGATGPAGSTGGNSQYIPNQSNYVGPPATPFMMIAYGQTNNGIIQFVLVDGAKLPGINNTSATVGSNENDNDPTQYYFVPFNDIIDLSRVVSVYYTIDTNKNVVFYDANLVNANPSSSAIPYQLLAYTKYKWDGDANTFAAWPSKSTPWNVSPAPDYQGYPVSMSFLFNEFNDSNYNTNEYTLKVGQFYHPFQTNLSNYPGYSAPSDYTNYCNEGYLSGYCPGYPVNFNYIYVPVQPGQLPTVANGVNNNIVNVAGVNYIWNFPVSSNVYNFNISSINNSQSVWYYPNQLSTGNLGAPNNTSYVDSQSAENNGSNFPYLINLFGSGIFGNSSGLGVLGCNCNSNNECAEDSNSYYQNNCNTIQAGIAQYLIYQFIPFSQLKSPNLGIVPQINTSPFNSYITLPQSISGNTGYNIISQNLINGNTGNIGFTTATSSIISDWMINPSNPTYNCSREITSTSYCGFLDYYESLFGISYIYGFCGGVGATGLAATVPFQVGACPSNQLCLPNFDYINNFNLSPFNCVDYNTGITTAQIDSYQISVPPNPSKTVSISYPPYTMAANYPSSNDTGGDTTSTTKSDIFFYIGIVLLVIIFIIFLVLIIKGIRNNSKNKRNLSQYTKLN